MGTIPRKPRRFDPATNALSFAQERAYLSRAPRPLSKPHAIHFGLWGETVDPAFDDEPRDVVRLVLRTDRPSQRED